MAEQRNYKDADVQAIIERALQGQARTGGGGVSHDDLVAIGTEVGLSRADIEAAAQELSEAQRDDEARSRIQAGRRRGLLAHAASFGLVNALLFAINALTTPGEWWVLFPVIFWGLALALHGGLALGTRVSKGRMERERRRIESERTVSSKSRVRLPDAAPAVVRINDELGADAVDAERPSTDAAAATREQRR